MARTCWEPVTWSFEEESPRKVKRFSKLWGNLSAGVGIPTREPDSACLLLLTLLSWATIRSICNLILCLRFWFFLEPGSNIVDPGLVKETQSQTSVLVTTSYLLVFLSLLHTTPPQLPSVHPETNPVSFCQITQVNGIMPLSKIINNKTYSTDSEYSSCSLTLPINFSPKT